MKSGILYGVGIGPGDPELLTLKAISVLKKVSAIAFPKSREGSLSNALSIIRDHVDLNDKLMLELNFIMTKDKAELAQSRRNAAIRISEELNKGRDVACITIGDPLLYSTFSYLFPLVSDMVPNIEIKVVPGISSIMASAAAITMPLVENEEKIAIIPASYDMSHMSEALRVFDTVVFMKVNNAMDSVLDILDKTGMKEHAVFVERCGYDSQRIVRDLDSLKDRKLDYLSMVIAKRS